MSGEPSEYIHYLACSASPSYHHQYDRCLWFTDQYYGIFNKNTAAQMTHLCIRVRGGVVPRSV